MRVTPHDIPAPLGYRPDIEGLRAIAILLVVAAHAKVPGLEGGVVGVDVFFVLSGYLVSALLTQEFFSCGRINFVAFYARRFRRLLPALLIMLLGTSIAAFVILPSSEQVTQTIAAACAAFGASNFHFAFTEQDYFAPSAESNLFLHTWSLGVEEQFYLIWPALLVLVVNVSCRQGRLSHITCLNWAMTLIIVFSLGACILLTDSAPTQAFYMMHSRAWQFALGALAWLQVQSVMAASSSLICGLGWLGMGMIGLAALMLDTSTGYPGVWALLPSLGAAAVLVTGSTQACSGVSWWLSMRPLPVIGRLSYSWYLWHWPVLLLGGALIPLENPATRFILVLIALALAVLSHYLVETPIRSSRLLAARPRMVIYGAITLMLLSANLLSNHWQHMALEKMESLEQRRYAAARADVPLIYARGCDDWFHSATLKLCNFGRNDAPHTVVVMGDSIGVQWFPAMVKVFDSQSWRLVVLTKSSCPMVDEPFFYQRIGRDYVECAQWRQQALAKMAELKPDVLLIGSTDSYGFTRQQWTEGTRRVLAQLAPYAGKLYLLRATPRLPFDGPVCLSKKYGLSLQPPPASSCSALSRDAQNNDVWGWLMAAVEPFRNVQLLDLNEAVCPNGKCVAELDGRVVFRDQQHLTADFAASLAPVLRAAVLSGKQIQAAVHAP